MDPTKATKASAYSQEMIEEEPPVPTVEHQSTKVIGMAETTKQTAESVTSDIPKDVAASKAEAGTRSWRTACSMCRTSKVCDIPQC